MRLKYLPVLFLTAVTFCCNAATFNTIATVTTHDTTHNSVKRDTVTWLDSSRNRQIPVAMYSNKDSSLSSQRYRQKLVILNPGYPGKNTDYGYIAKNLADLGYFVITIQHDLPTDASLPTTGKIYELRLPFWNTGLKNILFVIDKLKQEHANLDYKHLILIGHSNGGDIAMLFATKYAGLVKTVITLDNRSVPFPMTRHPKIFSIRSMDQPADNGVLPSAEDQKKYKIKIVKVNTRHNDMGGMGTKKQKDEINNYILSFLSAAN